jgi:serine/threonine-protein kinase
MHKILKEDPLAPSVLNVHVPTRLDKIVAKALAKAPEQRFQTAREFITALQTVPLGVPADSTEAMPIVGSHDATPHAAEPTAPVSPGGPTEAFHATDSTRRDDRPAADTAPESTPGRRRPSLLIGLVGMVAGVALAAFLFRPGAVPNPPASPQPPAADIQPPAPTPAATPAASAAPVAADKPVQDNPPAVVDTPTAHGNAEKKRPIAVAARKAAVAAPRDDCPTCNCPDLMTKISMGVESLSVAQRAFFRKNCR